MNARKHTRRARVWAAGKLLDLAEALPETKRGPIRHLQMIRGFQRKHEDEPSRDAKAPTNNRLTLSSMRLLEAYSIEGFAGLRVTIQRLFPGLSRELSRNNLLNELDESIRSLNAGAWWNVGMLIREKGRYLYGVPVREFSELPAQVESIGVSVQHILPSIAVLALDVRLTDDATAELNRVQAQQYLPEVTFRSILHWRSGHSELPAEWVRQRHVREWVDGLRSKIEVALGRFVTPGLFSGAVNERPRLPAVEVYLLSTSQAELSGELEKQSRRWLESYGIESAFNTYRSDAEWFQWPRVEQHRTLVSGHLLTVCLEKYLATISHPEAYSGETSAVLHHVEDGLNDLVPVIVTLQLLHHTRKVIQGLRERVFRRIAGGSLFTLRPLAWPTRLHVELLGQSMLLSRLRTEFERQEKRISHRMRGWDELKFVPKISTEDSGLRSDALDWIRSEFETIEPHLRLARDAFAEHFTARNTRSIYWLTVAVAILTVVQVLANRDFRPWLSPIVRVLKNLVPSP